METLFLFSRCSCLLLLVFVAIDGVAVPTADKVRGLRPLSQEPHYSHGNEHNQQFDTDAFLGKEEAAEVKNLTPEESKRRLRFVRVVVLPVIPN